ncbi:hypothetical protein [Photobacterium salinisoli]|uniref:hypothetical protein n=1 Tax=Photobacterium salinisoli TaxID=1616783 RepID=UPI000EA09015|nr:hypothetical protein [Photobacterium salinisoli]
MVTAIFIVGFILTIILAFRGVILANILKHDIGLKKGTIEVYYIIQVEAFSKGESVFDLKEESRKRLYRSCVKNIRIMYIIIFIMVASIFIGQTF